MMTSLNTNTKCDIAFVDLSDEPNESYRIMFTLKC